MEVPQHVVPLQQLVGDLEVLVDGPSHLGVAVVSRAIHFLIGIGMCIKNNKLDNNCILLKNQTTNNLQSEVSNG